jgi:DNA ligase-1
LALRFPRMLRWRTDKLLHEADTLQTLQALQGLQKGEASVPQA